MVNEDIYRDLLYQIGNAKEKINACYEKIDEYKYSLNRLKRYKKEVENQKEEFYLIIKDDKNNSKKKDCWKGASFDKFNNIMDDVLEEDYKYYNNCLDGILDSINDEMTRLENEILSKLGIIGKLSSWVNSLSNEIENFFN